MPTRGATLRTAVAGLALLTFVGIHALRLAGLEGWLARWNVDGLLIGLGALVVYLVLMAILTMLRPRASRRSRT